MRPEDLSITPAPTRAEAAAIAAAIRAATATARAGSGGDSWSNRGWGFAARLEAVGVDPGEVPRSRDPWRAATRSDPAVDRPGG